MSGLLGSFHFLRPLWLLALAALPLLWLVLRRGGGSDDSWRGAVDPHLLRHLLERDDGERGRSPNALLGLAWVLACVALAGPAWERLPQPLFENRAARVIAIELAPSMLAGDVKPSRVARAQYKIADILARSADAQTALIAYAADAFVVAPLTDDINTVANFVDALEPDVMPAPGNATGRAIDLAVKLVQQAGLHSGEVILLADSAGAGATAAAERARRAGVRISVLGVGTDQGAPVATANGGFLQDPHGNIAMPRLDSAALAAVAQAGGGRFAAYTSDARDLDAVLTDLRPLQAEQAAPSEAQSERFLDRGPWLLLALVPLAALGFRRGWLMLLPLLVLAAPHPARAMSWSDLWQRPDQQAQAALEAGDAKRAQALAHDPLLRGSAAYRAEDYAAAAQDFERRDQADAAYNLGNALARQKKYREALAAYDRALAQQPQMEDAIANRKAIEDFLAQQQKQDGGQGDKNDKHDDQRSGSDDKDSQQSQQDQQQRGDEQRDGQQQDGSDPSGENRQSNEQGKDQQDQAGQAGESQGDKQSSSAQSRPDNDKANAGKVPAQPESKAAEQKAQQQFQQAMDQALQKGKDQQQRPLRLGAREEGKPHDEKQQAVEQWLQRVPDDPGGLLRRKFQLESEHRQHGDDGNGGP